MSASPVSPSRTSCAPSVPCARLGSGSACSRGNNCRDSGGRCNGGSALKRPSDSDLECPGERLVRRSIQIPGDMPATTAATPRHYPTRGRSVLFHLDAANYPQLKLTRLEQGFPEHTAIFHHSSHRIVAGDRKSPAATLVVHHLVGPQRTRRALDLQSS